MKRPPKYISGDAHDVIRLLQVMTMPKKEKATSYIGLRVPDEVHQFFKLFAKMQGTTVTDVLVQGGLKLADEYLKNYEGPVPEEWFKLFPQYFK